MRLIDADAFIAEISDLYKQAGWTEREIHFSLMDNICNIKMMPTIDAIPVEFIEEEINTLDEIVHDILAEKSGSNLPAEIWLAFRSALKTLIDRWDENTERSDLS